MERGRAYPGRVGRIVIHFKQSSVLWDRNSHTEAIIAGSYAIQMEAAGGTLVPFTTFDFLRACKHLGMSTAWKLAALGTRGGEFSVRVPGHDHALRLRRDGIDRRVLTDVFVTRIYPADLAPPEPEFIVDAGAHAGFATCYFAQKFPKARILALEADPNNFARLILNTRSHANVTALHAALWRTDGTIRVGTSNQSWNIQTSAAGSGTEVRAVSVPTLLREAGAKQIDLLKMNVEGAERDIFAGDTDWLRRVGVLMIQLHDQYWPGCAQPVYAAAVKVGFQKYQAGDIDVLVFPREAGLR